MTLLTALIVGIVTGLRVQNRRRRLWITGIAVLVMLPIQSFVMPLFIEPGFSLSDPGYWGVQPFILLLGLLVCTGVAYLRRRRMHRAATAQAVAH